LGSDHGGYRLKERLKEHLGNLAYDFGTYSEASCDYPDIAKKVAKAVANGEYAMGILCCGTGIGMSIAANKTEGIRAAVVSDKFSAEMARAHNDANILCLGERVIDTETALELTAIFLSTPFAGGRHACRVEKI